MRRALPVLALAGLILLPAVAFAAPSPFGVGLPEPSAGGLFPAVAALQKQFYRDLVAALKAFRESGGAFWWLAGLSFLYGVVHAAGPGHGKVVIASYLLATRDGARRGILLSFVSAGVQAVSAVVLVSVLAALLNRTSMALTEAASLLELASFALIAALGAWLVFAKGRRLVFLLGEGQRAHSLGAAAVTHAPHHHHRHDDHGGHDHDGHGACGCGHHHGPVESKASGGAKSALAAILAVGLRPCSGAIIVLVFALSQGLYAAGVASVFLMAAGTAITVAALALLAVAARDTAARFAASSARAAPIMAGVELLGALLVLALGVVLLGGALA